MPIREYSGNAKATTLSGGISAAASSIAVADATGYPTGATGPFVITVDAGNAAEEKVLCLSRTGNTFTVDSRGWDGTTASDHDNAAAVAHTYSATDAREANAHVNATHADASLLVSKAGGDTITASDAAVIPLVVKGAASQTANLLEAQDSAGTALLYIDSNGSLFTSDGSQIFTSAAATERGLIKAAVAGQKGLTVRGAASQTANLAEFQNSAGTVLLSVASTGSLIVASANLGLGSAGVSNGGNNSIVLTNGTAPTSDVSGAGSLYVASGALYYRGELGTVTKIANA